jgi:hypothetical protein
MVQNCQLTDQFVATNNFSANATYVPVDNDEDGAADVQKGGNRLS